MVSAPSTPAAHRSDSTATHTGTTTTTKESTRS